MMAVRGACAVIALIVCAWFAIGTRQAQNTFRAEAFVTTHHVASPSQGRAVQAWLSAASLLNPDTTVTLLQGRAAQELGHAQRAEQIITPITRKEPQNLDAWLSLAYVSGHDPGLFARALSRVKRLDPLGG
jgi:hypothetical protein